MTRPISATALDKLRKKGKRVTPEQNQASKPSQRNKKAREMTTVDNGVETVPIVDSSVETALGKKKPRAGYTIDSQSNGSGSLRKNFLLDNQTCEQLENLAFALTKTRRKNRVSASAIVRAALGEFFELTQEEQLASLGD